jgi:type I restriction enzyme S subunit
MMALIVWKQIKLGALGDFRNGVNFNRSKKGRGLGLINVKDLYNDGPYINFDTLDKVDLADNRGIDKYFVKKGDIFFSRSSVKREGVAVVSMAPKSSNEVIHCGFVIRFRLNTSEAIPLFLTYLLRSDYYRKLLINISGGTAIFNVSQDTLSNLEINLPPLEIQHKISSILSAYDDLIENNTLRIQILEEMAQLIYREWFVNFRFPGHEKVKMVKSEQGMIPEGWEVKHIEDILFSIESGSRPKGGINPNDKDIPSIGAENILGLGRYDYSKEKYVNYEFYKNMKQGHVKSGDVLLYKDGAKIGRKSLFRDGFPHETCCINEHVFILRTNEKYTPNYLYFWLDLPEITQKIINLNANAAQPGINQKGVKGLPALLPTVSLIKSFDNISEPILGEIFNLAKKNNALRKTRDFLLPKFINGEIDVEQLDIKTEWSWHKETTQRPF